MKIQEHSLVSEGEIADVCFLICLFLEGILKSSCKNAIKNKSFSAKCLKSMQIERILNSHENACYKKLNMDFKVLH